MTEYLEREGLPKLAYVYTSPKASFRRKPGSRAANDRIPAKAGMTGGKGDPSTALAGARSAQDDSKQLPLVMFCGGFKSDMAGTKATFLEERCKARGQGYLRFDYSGHGESGGKFEEGTISAWRDDALAVLDHVNPDKGSVLLVGSSMGGWISLLIAKARPSQIKAMIGIAAAPDFSKNFAPELMSVEQQESYARDGYYLLPNEYDEPYTITRGLLEDGDQNCLLHEQHDLGVPVHLLQGTEDKAVAVEVAYAIQKAFGDMVEITLIEGGDHSLSQPEDLALLDEKIQEFSV